LLGVELRFSGLVGPVTPFPESGLCEQTADHGMAQDVLKAVRELDGEPKTWDLQKCVSVRWPGNSPVRANIELSIGLRKKVEQRYHEAINEVAMGFAQTLLVNYEEELTATFGATFSLGNFGSLSLSVQSPLWVRQRSSNSVMSCRKTRAICRVLRVEPRQNDYRRSALLISHQYDTETRPQD
jgi:hypothetical protein